MYKFEREKEKYKEEEIHFIYEVGSMVATKKTVEEICEECSISRRTYFYWKKRFKAEIKEVKRDEILEIKDSVISNIHEYVNSSNSKQREKGTDMFIKLYGSEGFKEELTDNTAEKEIDAEAILRELGL